MSSVKSDSRSGKHWKIVAVRHAQFDEPPRLREFKQGLGVCCADELPEIMLDTLAESSTIRRLELSPAGLDEPQGLAVLPKSSSNEDTFFSGWSMTIESAGDRIDLNSLGYYSSQQVMRILRSDEIKTLNPSRVLLEPKISDVGFDLRYLMDREESFAVEHELAALETGACRNKFVEVFCIEYRLRDGRKVWWKESMNCSRAFGFARALARDGRKPRVFKLEFAPNEVQTHSVQKWKVRSEELCQS